MRTRRTTPVHACAVFRYAREGGNGEVTSGYAYLTDGAGTMPGAFTRPAPIPPMPWIEQPTRGWIAGVVTAADASPADGAAVKVKRAGFPLFRRTRTMLIDGNGHYGLTNLKPGRYHVGIDGAKEGQVTITVEAGKVARAVFDPPGPSR